jgi:hypothetical protein
LYSHFESSGLHNHSYVVVFGSDITFAQQKDTAVGLGKGVLLLADQTVKAAYAMWK